MPNTDMGKGSLINGKYKIVSTPHSKVKIGKYCAIGPNLKIITINHDYNYPAIQVTFYKKFFKNNHPGEINNPPTKERTKGHVFIGSDVWIGEDVFIGSGVKIGDGCCIGAKSVITKDLEPYSICVGTPCKAIKKRYSEEIINFLMELKWWNWDEKKIMKNKKFFETNLNQHSLEYIKSIIV